MSSIRAFANWTCPLAAACEARISLIDSDGFTFWESVSGPSPLDLQALNPAEGTWHVNVGRSFNPSVTYEAEGTLDVVICCVGQGESFDESGGG